VSIFRAANIFDEGTQFLAERGQNLVFVLDRVCVAKVNIGSWSARTFRAHRLLTIEKRDELLASPFGPKS
jgi:hypothetical protein